MGETLPSLERPSNFKAIPYSKFKEHTSSLEKVFSQESSNSLIPGLIDRNSKPMNRNSLIQINERRLSNMIGLSSTLPKRGETSSLELNKIEENHSVSIIGS